jgi:transcriptional regulator with GAF, ATPase, and Fis domain
LSQLGKQRDALSDYEALFSIASELSRINDYDELLDTLVNRALHLLGGDRGFLVLQQKDRLHLKVIRNWSREDFEEKRDAISKTIVQEAFSSAEPIVIEDALSEARFRNTVSVQSLFIRSVLASSLAVDGKIVGVLYLESRSTKQFFSQPELALFKKLLAFADHSISALLQRLLVEQQSQLLSREILSAYQFPDVISRDDRFLRLLKTVGQAAGADLPVLIQGESGTGKELIARALHVNSARKKAPFIVINCSAISANLLESELFGHIKGAFTGAIQNKQGLIAAAHQGTLFLDEIGELPKEFQAKLLRTIQFGEVQPVGSSQTQTYDVRFISATNRNLEEEVEEENFRQDLLFRLNAITIHLPSLRERSGDIVLLFKHFLSIAATRANRAIPVLDAGVEEDLLSYPWPGNIRELENEARRALAMTTPDEKISRSTLSPKITARKDEERGLISLAQAERAQLELHLRASNGNRTRAAETLGITRQGLRKMLLRHGID